MSLSLKISIVDTNQQRTMRFAATMSVYEACKQISEKVNISGEDHGLFSPPNGPRDKPRWLKMDRTLGSYELESGATLEYKKKHRLLKIKLLDNTQKRILFDDSLIVKEIVLILGEKLGLENVEEFALQVESDKDGKWLNGDFALYEQGVDHEDVLVLKKKFFVSDANVDTNNPAQVHFVYIQSRNAIIDGSHPCSQPEAIQFAALESQINYGNQNPTTHQPTYFKNILKDVLPPQWTKIKGIEKDIIANWKKLMGMTEVNAKYRYIQLCRSLKTYGITAFNVQEVNTGEQGKKRLRPLLLGITRDSILKMSPETKEVEMTYPLKIVRRWAASPQSFTVDFGDHQDDYLNLQTTQGEAIAQLLAGYIEIILKRRKDTAKPINEEDMIGMEESISIPRGRAGSSYSSGYSGNSNFGQSMTRTPSNSSGSSSLTHVGSFNQGSGETPVHRIMALAKSGVVGKVQITDFKGTRMALDELLNDLTSVEGMVKADPFLVQSILNPDGMNGMTITEDMAGNKLASCTALVNIGVEQLNAMLTQDELRDQLLNGAFDDKAAELARNVAQVLEASILATAVGTESRSGDLLAAAKRVATSTRALLNQMQKIKDNPNDAAARAALLDEKKTFQMAECFLRGAGQGMVLDNTSEQLIVGGAVSLNAAAIDLVEALKGNRGKIGILDFLEPAKKQKLLETATAVVQATGKGLNSIQTFAPSMLMEDEHKEQVNHAMSLISEVMGFIGEAIQEAGPETQQALEAFLVPMLNSKNQLEASLICATRRGEQSQGALITASNQVNMAMAQLLSATGMEDEVMFERARDAVKEACDSVIVLTKKSTNGMVDKSTRNRLLQGAEALSEAFKAFTESAAASMGHKDDPIKQERMMVASQKLAVALNTLLGDSEKEAAVQSLFSSIKEAAGNSTTLVNTTKLAAQNCLLVDEKNSSAIELITLSNETASGVAGLLTALRTANSSTIDALPTVLSELVNTCQKSASPVANLVAQVKHSGLKIGAAPKIRTELKTQAEKASSSLQLMLEASKKVVEASGMAELEESIQQLGAVDSSLGAAMIGSTAGMLQAVIGMTEEGAVELLAMATTQLAIPTKNLLDASRDPATKQIGPASKACVDGLQQVVNATKTLAGILPKKDMQSGLLLCAKDLADKMGQLFSAVRTLSTNPNDKTLQEMVGNATKRVTEARTNLVRNAKGTNDPISNEIDIALETIKSDIARLTPHNFNSGNFTSFVEQLGSYARALQAAALQLGDESITGGNPDVLTQTCHAVAGLITPMVDTANNTAATVPKDDHKESIINGARQLATSSMSVVTSAKLAFLHKGDPSIAAQLSEDTKSVSNALNELQNAMNGARPGQLECEAALESISNSTAMLEPSAPFPPEADDEQYKNPDTVKELVTKCSKDLALSTSQILATARSAPEKAGNAALEASKALASILTTIKASSPKVQGLTEFSDPAKAIEESTLVMRENVDKPKIVIKETKNISPLIADLVQTSKKVAATLTDGTAQNKLIKAAQNLHGSKTHMINAAKAAAAKTPGCEEDLKKACDEIIQHTKKLVSVASRVLPQESATPELKAQNDLLVSAAKGLALSTSQLILASKVVSARHKDSTGHHQLSNSAKEVTDAIQALLNAAKGLAADQIKCEEALEIISAATENLDGLILSAAVGGLDGLAPPGKTYAQFREEVVQHALGLSQSVSLMVSGTLKRETANIAKGAEGTAEGINTLVTSCTVAASAAPDKNTQKQLLGLSKGTVESVYKLVHACKITASANASGTGNTEQSQALVTSHSKETVEAIKGLISTLKLGVAGSKECDEAASLIQNLVKELEEPTPPTKQTFKQCKDQLAIMTKTLAPTIQRLVAASKNEGEELGSAAKAIGDAMPFFIEAVKTAISATSGEKAKNSLIEAGKAVVNATKTVIQNAKVMASDRSNLASQKKLTQSQMQMNDAIAKLATSMATGEVEYEQSTSEIRNLIASLDAASLFAAAGQLDAVDSHDSADELYNKLSKAVEGVQKAVKSVETAASVSMEQVGNASKDLSSASSLLVAATKHAAAIAGDISAQQQLLGIARSACIETRKVLQAAKDVVTLPESELSQDSLSESSIQIVGTLKSLLTEAQNATAEASKGDKKMNATKAEILRLIDRLVEPDNLGNTNASPVDIIDSAKGVATATAKMISSMSSQEELLTCAKTAVKANAVLLGNAKGALRLTKDKDQQRNLMDAAKSVANSTTHLFDALKSGVRANSSIAQTRIAEASDEVANTISDMISMASSLPGAEKVKPENDIEEVAEEELLNAAKAIDAAAAQLANKKQQPERKEGDPEDWSPDIDVNVNESIIEAARSVAANTGTLVRSAITIQKELNEKGKTSAEAKLHKFYRKDSIFTEGLISAAKMVAATTEQLVKAANSCSQAEVEEEALIASARGVAAATAQLVASSRVKIGIDNPNQKKLQEAAKGVVGATTNLVEVAKSLADEIETEKQKKAELESKTKQQQEEANNFSKSMVMEIEQQTKILKLERELEKARAAMLNMRKKNYQ